MPDPSDRFYHQKGRPQQIRGPLSKTSAAEVDCATVDKFQFSFKMIVFWSNLPHWHNSWYITDYYYDKYNIRTEIFKSQIIANVTKQTPTFTDFL